MIEAQEEKLEEYGNQRVLADHYAENERISFQADEEYKVEGANARASNAHKSMDTTAYMASCLESPYSIPKQGKLTGVPSDCSPFVDHLAEEFPNRQSFGA